MNFIKSLAAGAAVLALGLATTAQAAQTRSSLTLPVKKAAAIKASAKASRLSRSSAALEGETSSLSPAAIAGLVLVGVGTTVVIATSGDDSPGS
ncbi:hypothetical protein [Novosphingobium cyanobacteriorum]|uniref:Uncharacterized protein n=1 Tax=Novosphingobium cyanobacteriorum TaxID=3024215 RepID=A0ABT6CE17_9SPHN|nr:hypothetical protein [Novosphingobium cyanobacteriorum]MDF8332170.1 hypothetical protein [Novosphingobium cyanobacteriorum]